MKVDITLRTTDTKSVLAAGDLVVLLTGSARVSKRTSHIGYRGFFKSIPTSSRNFLRWDAPKRVDAVGIVLDSSCLTGSSVKGKILVLWDGETLVGCEEDFEAVSSV